MLKSQRLDPVLLALCAVLRTRPRGRAPMAIAYERSGRGTTDLPANRPAPFARSSILQSVSEPSGWTSVRVDEVEAVPWRGTELVWRPLRYALDTRVVGMGGYTAAEVGQEVVEGHRESEDGRGHEEVYIVVRGRATVTLETRRLTRRRAPSCASATRGSTDERWQPSRTRS